MTKEENPIGYQFTPVPTNLIFMLDPSCFKLMSLLIQEESYQKAKNNVKNNCFPEAIKRLSLRIPMCEKDVKLTIKSLEEANLIDVIEQGQYHKPNLFKINWDRIKEVDQICVTDLTNDVVPMICKKKRPNKKDLAESTLEENVSIDNINESASGENDGQSIGRVDGQSSGQSDTPLLDNTYKLNNIDNNVINNNIINNEVIEKESIHSLNIEIGDKGKGFVDINDQEVINASVTSQTDAQHLEPTTLEDRLNNYLDNRPEKVALSMRVMSIKEHFHPDEYQAIDTIVRRKEYKHYNIRDYIMRYLTE